MSIYDIFILLGGVGLFLYGMTIMSSGLKNACGDNLKVILGKATKNKVTSILAGIAVTIFVQSSSATDVMVIGFVTSGLMTLSQAIGVIMGANIGTTVTAQITAFNIGAYAPMILFLGAVMNLFLKNRTLKEVGSVILGFGMLFQGITLMKVSPSRRCCRAHLRQLLSSRPLQCRISSATRQQYTWSSVQPSVLLCPTFWQALQPTATASAARC